MDVGRGIRCSTRRTAGAAYFEGAGKWARDAFDRTPESSRQARAFTVCAALRSLGRQGVAELVDRCCVRAQEFAAQISQLPACTVLNDFVVNLFRFTHDETTNAVLAPVQASGEAWMGGTTWDGRPAIRLSVSSWRTTADDIASTVAAFERAVTVAR